MRVFITGATGFLGTPLVEELIAAGHSVLGLARSEKSAAQLRSQGAEAVIGTVEDVDVLARSAGQCDAVIHLAFIMDFTNIEGVCAIDRAALTAMGDALVAAGKSDTALIATTATMMLQHGTTAVETDGPDMANPMLAARGASEPVCLAYKDKGVRASVVRIPPTAHGEGKSGLMGYLVDTAAQKGVSVYAEGTHRWSACHRSDVAKLYRIALEKGAPGSVYHAVGEEGVPVKDIATEIGAQLGLPVKSVSAEETQAHFGWIAFGVLADNPVSSELTRQRTGWAPSGPTAVQDVAACIKSTKSN